VAIQDVASEDEGRLSGKGRVRHFKSGGLRERVNISVTLETRVISPSGSPQTKRCGSVTRMRCSRVEPVLQPVESKKIGACASVVPSAPDPLVCSAAMDLARCSTFGRVPGSRRAQCQISRKKRRIARQSSLTRLLRALPQSAGPRAAVRKSVFCNSSHAK